MFMQKRKMTKTKLSFLFVGIAMLLTLSGILCHLVALGKNVRETKNYVESLGGKAYVEPVMLDEAFPAVRLILLALTPFVGGDAVTSITAIDLSNAKLSSEDMRALKRAESLQVLHLDGANIEGRLVEDAVAFGSLRVLSLRNSSATEDQVEMLRTLMPNTDIRF